MCISLPNSFVIFKNSTSSDPCTVTKKGGRAIGDLSMEALGAIRYPEVYPQWYTYITSFSGALDLEGIRSRLLD